MKQLQNNFTTPEQSKRLLELGVPADSADCYFYTSVDKHPKIRTSDKPINYPCWSVGRLIEIYLIASGADYINCHFSPCVHILDKILMWYEHSNKELDFSQLED